MAKWSDCIHGVYIFLSFLSLVFGKDWHRIKSYGDCGDGEDEDDEDVSSCFIPHLGCSVNNASIVCSITQLTCRHQNTQLQLNCNLPACSSP